MSDDEESDKDEDEGEGDDREAIAREIFIEDDQDDEVTEQRESLEQTAQQDKEFPDLEASEGESGQC